MSIDVERAQQLATEIRRRRIQNRIRDAGLSAMLIAVCVKHSVTAAALIGGAGRGEGGGGALRKHVHAARRELWAQIAVERRMSLSEIGRMFERHHSTILFGLKKCGVKVTKPNDHVPTAVELGFVPKLHLPPDVEKGLRLMFVIAETHKKMLSKEGQQRLKAAWDFFALEP